MKLIRLALAGVAAVGMAWLGAAQPMFLHAQDAVVVQYDSPNWQAPRGYDEAYAENGTPNMVARQGYASGFNQGQADASRGRKFNPTENDAYKKAVIPKGMSHDDFRQQFREAFVKGYSNGYKGDAH